MTNKKTGKQSFKLRIGHKISLLTSIITILAMSVFWLVTSYNNENTLRQQTNSLGEALAKQTALLVTESVLANDLISMNVVLGQLTADGVVEQAAILDFDNQIVAVSLAQPQVSNSSSSFEKTIGRYKAERVFGSYTAPISLQDSIAGYVRIDIDLGYIDKNIVLNFLSISVALLLLLLLAVSASLILAQHLTFPLRILAASMQGLRVNKVTKTEGLSACPGDDRSDEIGLVIRHYNYLINLIPKNFFQDHFSQNSLSQMKGNDGNSGRSTFISILSIKLSNYTALYDAAGPQISAQIIEKSYYQLVKITHLYNGTIESFSDGNILVTFSAAQPDEEHSFHGVCCAQLFLEVIDALKEEFLQQSEVTPHFKLGLHCSEVLVTSLPSQGINQHTVIGSGLKIANDICRECPDNSLIISEDIFIHVDADSRLRTQEHLILKNTDAINPIKTFLVNEPEENTHQLLKQQVMRILAEE